MRCRPCQVAALVLCTWVCLACGIPAQAAQKPDSLVVFLVRHAEKVDASEDAELSEAGVARAQTLAAVLRDAAIEHVHSSDFVRTRDTARPIAEQRGLQVGLYSPYHLDELVGRLREAGGRHLVVGHSNSTPALVELLGGRPGPEIVEGSEYDRIYAVTVARGGDVSTILLRYGEPGS